MVQSKTKTKTKPKSRPQPKRKSRSHKGKKQPSYSDIDLDVDENKLPPKTLPRNSFTFSQRNKYWLLVIVVVLAIWAIWWLSQSWAVRSSVAQANTYPKASVLGEAVGNLDADHLNSRLAKLKSEFENKDIIMVNSKDKLVIKSGKIGVTFDAQATGRAIMQLNNLDILDKYKLLKGEISSVIKPIVSVNNEECTKALSVIPAVQIAPKDASIYFDKGVKIKSDQPGSKFNASLTCRGLPKQLADNTFVHDMYFDVTSAAIVKADLESKVSQIQSLIGESLVLKGGDYQRTLTPEQLLGLLNVAKAGSDTKIEWVTAKLDDIVNDIASKVNTYTSAPSTGACQYASSNGGNWLDKTATKKIFTDLGVGKPRSYDLPIVYHAPVTSTRKPLAAGNSGTIYLTYDDGLTYGNRIMDYASCYGIKVTFFELGSRVGIDTAPLRRAIAEGHAVQSHGFIHAMYDYGDRSYDWQFNDINQSISAIMGVTGVRPTYFRPPGGNRSSNTYAAASANAIHLILWGETSRDATPGGISSSQTCANVLDGAFPGASVLMHSTKLSTAEALPCIAEGLAARGYTMRALR